MAKLSVAVIFGGRSGEHEVSLLSAQSVIKALDKSKYDVLPVLIDQTGRWFLTDQKAIAKAGDKAVYLLPTTRNLSLLSKDISSSRRKIDVVFPVLHGTYGEDGSIQGLLELVDIPYIGAGVLGSAVGMDKEIMKKLLWADKLPIVKFRAVLRKAVSEKMVNQLEKEFSYPLFVKPANLGSSVGISKVHKRSEFLPALKLAATYDRKILIEEGVAGAREIEVSVLGNDNPEASLPGEVIPSNEFYDFNAKYIDGKSQLIIPAELTSVQVKKFQELSLTAFKTLDLKGMARVDFLLSKKTGKIYVNEVNTIPGFTNISMYPKMWEKSGLGYSQLLDRLINLAIEYHNDKKQNKTQFQSKLLTK